MWLYNLSHGLGIHSWDLPALCALLIIVVMLIVHHHNQKGRKKDFENQLQEKVRDIRSNPNGNAAKI